MQPWLASRSNQPTVYFTLGTVFNNECGDLFSRVITGLRDLPINLFVTVGRDIDPTELGLQPANVQIAQYIPQTELLPYCSLVVSHGGSGSVMGALAYGLPLVVIPMGGDQPLNAARCEALGLGRVLDAVRCTSNDARDAVSAVLEDSRFRHAAMGLRDEIDALPGTDYALTLLEELACL